MVVAAGFGHLLRFLCLFGRYLELVWYLHSEGASSFFDRRGVCDTAEICSCKRLTAGRGTPSCFGSTGDFVFHFDGHGAVWTTVGWNSAEVGIPVKRRRLPREPGRSHTSPESPCQGFIQPLRCGSREAREIGNA